MSHNEKNRGCLRTAFSRTHKSSVLLAAGSSSGDGDNETPVMFFADRDTDTSDDGTIEKESPEEKIANEKKIAEEKAEKERLAEEARLAEKAEKERMEKERVAERQKAEEALRLATEEQREMQLQGLKKSVGNVKESVENVIVSRNKRTRALTDVFFFARLCSFVSNHAMHYPLICRPIISDWINHI